MRHGFSLFKSSETDNVNRTNNDFDLLGLDSASSPENKNNLFDHGGFSQATFGNQQKQSTAGQQPVSSLVDTTQHIQKPKVSISYKYHCFIKKNRNAAR